MIMILNHQHQIDDQKQSLLSRYMKRQTNLPYSNIEVVIEDPKLQPERQMKKLLLKLSIAHKQFLSQKYDLKYDLKFIHLTFQHRIEPCSINKTRIRKGITKKPSWLTNISIDESFKTISCNVTHHLFLPNQVILIIYSR